MTRPAPEHERLLRPGEVATLFRVGYAAVLRWERLGLLHSLRTPGGERRYREAEVLARRDGRQWVPPEAITTPLPADARLSDLPGGAATAATKGLRGT